MKSESASCICEYHDPSGVFPLIASHVLSRLPLRNLHWQSGDRPVRSIDSLHVDFKPAGDGISSRPQSSQSSAPGAPDHGLSNAAPVKERRHQIPGLRQTPYLKLYLLRCDDVETYRESSRKTLREWLKAHIPPSQKSSASSAQENHDAFDWMILHVVLPNTAASAQPRYNKSSSRKEDDDDDDRPQKSGSRLKIGRSSSTILEKIKADFNTSGRRAPDRVAQIRLLEDEVPPHYTPVKLITENGYVESPQERLTAWNDFISKVKDRILTSFDLRVRQYEDDIKERGSQRALPGWNFCTFFVLKEGLARAFESVGLLDDALLGYDELSVELELVLHERSLGTVFSPFADDLKTLIELLQSQYGDQLANWHWQRQPISAQRKPYREMILANRISIFEFRCYIFARQVEILLRMGNLHLEDSAVQLSGQSSESPQAQDTAPIADICRRLRLFVSIASNALRQELVEVASTLSIQLSRKQVHNVCASWIYATCQQILDVTQSSMLAEALGGAKLYLHQFTSLPKSDSRTPLHSSLTIPGSKLRTDARQESTEETADTIADLFDERARFNLYSKPEYRAAIRILAARRAEIISMQKRTVEKLAGQLGWSVGLSQIQAAPASIAGYVSSGDPTAETNPSEQPLAHGDDQASFLCIFPLISASQSESECRKLCLNLVNSGLQHCMVADSIHAGEKLLAELAVLVFQEGDYGQASHILHQLSPLYSGAEWDLIVTRLVAVHARCLKQLDRRQEYVLKLLTLLQSRVRRAKDSSFPHMSLSNTSTLTDDHQIDQVFGQVDILEELLEQQKHLPSEISIPMTDFFREVAVEPYIRLQNDKDGFDMRLTFCHSLEQDITFDSCSLLLRGPGANSPLEIELLSKGAVVASKGMVEVIVSSNVCVLEEFSIEYAALLLGKLSFRHEGFFRHHGLRMQTSRQSGQAPAEQKMHVLTYPRPDSFSIQATVSRHVQLDRQRTLELDCRAGKNDIESLQLRFRSLTGGLRLRTAEAFDTSNKPLLIKYSKAGALDLPGLSSGASFSVALPYNIDGNLPEITLRIEATYVTKEGKFEFVNTPVIRIALPLDVNVNDLFKASTLFSRFNIRTADSIPMELLGIQLQGTNDFDVRSPPCSVTPVTVFGRQPIPVLYQIYKRAAMGDRTSQAIEKPMKLDIRYQQFDEILAEMVRHNVRSSLQNYPDRSVAHVIEESFIRKLPQVLTIEDLSEAALLQELIFPSYEAMDWQSFVRLLPGTISQQAERFLRDWHQQNPVITLDHDELENAKTRLERRLTIVVPIPRLQALQTVVLDIAKPKGVFNSGSTIAATLTINQTRVWDSPGAIAAIIKSSDEELELIVDLDAPPDTWVIGGLRRFRCSVKAEQTVSFPIMLIPLKAGRLPYPSVSVRIIGKGAEQISSATDYTGVGESVLVVDDIGNVSVGLKEAALGTEVAVQDVQGRVMV